MNVPPVDVGSTPAASSLPFLDEARRERLCLLAEAETGMDLSGDRLQRLGSSADRACRTLRIRSGDEFERMLADPSAHALFLERLSAELTIGETYFFRNEHHFRALREDVLPAILRDNRERREIRIWSAGCATGEEPYSLAILLDQLLGPHSGWGISILATDLNPAFLDRARQACYRPWSFRGTSIHQDRNYFEPEGDGFRLDPRIRDRVHFSYLNLVKDVFPSPLTGTLGLDLILFRNVTIYLKREVTEAILDRMHRALRPGGWLLMSETEILPMEARGFQIRRLGEATFYVRSDGSDGRIVPPPRPVLMDPAPRPFAGVRVPSVPEWVPLPVPSAATPPSGDAADPWDRIASRLARGDVDGAEAAIDRIADRRTRASLRLRICGLLLGSADVRHSRRMLDRALEEEPLLVEGHLLKASFAQEAGDLAGAEAACRRALYVDRQNPLIHFRLALVQQEAGDAEGAGRSLRNVLEVLRGRPHGAPVPFGEGLSCGRLGEMARALLEPRG